MATKEEEKYPSELLSSHETEDTPEQDRVNPEHPGDYEWIYYDYEKNLYGKWLVQKNFDELNSTWRMIIDAKRNGKLEGYTALKTSTAVYRPGTYGPGPITTGMIYVFTTEENCKSVGTKLCYLVRQDIKYKTEEATREGIYVGDAHNRPVIKYKIYYNDGIPTFTQKLHTCPGFDLKREDIWHLNIVRNFHYSETKPHGKWVLTVNIKEATGVWHILRRKIEKNEYPGILKLECPKCDRNLQTVYVYTTESECDDIGENLLDLMERDIYYESADGEQLHEKKWE